MNELKSERKRSVRFADSWTDIWNEESEIHGFDDLWCWNVKSFRFGLLHSFQFECTKWGIGLNRPVRVDLLTDRSACMPCVGDVCCYCHTRTHARTFFLWESSFDIIQSELLMNLHSLSAHYIEYIQIKYLAKNRNTHKKCCIRFKYKSNNLCFSFQFKSVSMISVPKRIIHTQNTFNHKSHNN